MKQSGKKNKKKNRKDGINLRVLWAFLKLLISPQSLLVFMYPSQHFRNFSIEVNSRIRLAASASLLMFGDFSNQKADYRQKYLLF